MTGLDLQLAQRIEEALRIQSFDGSLPDVPESLKLLSAVASEYLGQAVPSEVRPVAAGIARMAKPGRLRASEEVEFRSALANLRDLLAAQQELEKTTSQFADDPEMVQEFLVETREHLSAVETGLLALERVPGDVEALNSVFRSFHTIKGLAAFLG